MTLSHTEEASVDTGSVLVLRAGALATVQISNPHKKNALTKEMCITLTKTMAELDRDPEVLVIALSGDGRDFSAGAALNDLDRVLFDLEEGPEPVDHLSNADAAIRAVRKPTISLVRGICMGGGWQIAAACDIILAADDTRIAITPAKLGILYPRPGLERLMERVGADRAKFLLFTGNEVTPRKAVEWKLVTELFPSDEFEGATQQILQTMTQRSQFSIARMKEFMDLPAGGKQDMAWEASWKEFPAHEDLAHGRAAFLAGAVPEFNWKITADDEA